MSVKAGFKTATKDLKCSVCRSPIAEGERYFEAKAPFSKTVTNCVACVKKTGIFVDEDIQDDRGVSVNGVKLLASLTHLKRAKKIV